jgi:hypothetical protein
VTSLPLELCLVSLCALAPTIAAVHAQDESGEEAPEVDLAAARETLAALAERVEGTQVLAADYRQVRETFLLGKPIVSKGRLYLRREPACLRMDVREPKRALIRSDATSHLTWYVGQPRAERLVFPENEAVGTLVRLLTGDVEDLETAFEIAAFAKDEERATLALVPRDEALRKHLARLELAISAATGLPESIEHENPEGESVRIELTEPTLAKELEDQDRLFDHPLPESVKVVTRRIERP